MPSLKPITTHTIKTYFRGNETEVSEQADKTNTIISNIVEKILPQLRENSVASFPSSDLMGMASLETASNWVKIEIEAQGEMDLEDPEPFFDTLPDFSTIQMCQFIVKKKKTLKEESKESKKPSSDS